MKKLLVVCCLSIAIVYITALPVSNQGEDELLSSSDGGPVERPKRTVGILRDLFPNFSQMIDRKIQQLTRIVFRIVGRLVLTGGGGGGGGGGDDDDDRKVSITLPTYPPDLLEDEDEDEDSTGSSASTDANTSTESTTPDGEENSVAESRVNPVRAKREAPKQDLEEEEEEDDSEDLEPEATGDNEVSEDNDAESSEIDDEEEEEEDPRNKRFLNFNLGATADAQAGGSGGGSGNFLFDIVRRSADRAARMAGTVYRVLAGTDDAGLPTYQSARSLVAGSGQAPDGGDGAAAANGALEEHKDESAYGVGVPGPLTRLFVVANKGVASLIQDLILRLAQTSEKIVNFKARLITSII
ncbi:uncharacterized protein isoform X2 [Rhodnius prolixus]|uniref:uncharacterized protein isoform X2 n=1 Tax=Rhodnius prolixus TaxID=13249 RepID=UPI003D18E348